jgi:type I restriction enzyme R subunit
MCHGHHFAETRAIIDEQLRDVGWEADTGVPSILCAVKGRNFAIAEWPTASGPADRRGE